MQQVAASVESKTMNNPENTYTLRINKEDARTLFKLAVFLRTTRGESASTRIIADFHKQIAMQSAARKRAPKPQGWPTPAEDPVALSRLSITRKRAILAELGQDDRGTSQELSHRIRHYYIDLNQKKRYGTNDQIDARLAQLGLSMTGSRETKQFRLDDYRADQKRKASMPATDDNVELLAAAITVGIQLLPESLNTLQVDALARRMDNDGLDWDMIKDHTPDEMAAMLAEVMAQPLDRVGETLGHVEEDPTLPGDEFHRDDMSEGSRADHSSYGGEDVIAYQQITGSL